VFQKSRRITSLAQRILASQDRLCSKQLVPENSLYDCITNNDFKVFTLQENPKIESIVACKSATKKDASKYTHTKYICIQGCRCLKGMLKLSRLGDKFALSH
jgi:hypothetical protein